MKLQFSTSCLALAASALLTTPAFAQARPDEPSTVIVTGAATPVEAEKLGQTITVISAATIEAQGYTFVPDVLRQVPGAAVNQPGAPGAFTQVRMRGGEANHTIVLIDGIDITSPDIGETDFSTLVTGGLSRIEVLRGPQSGLYGSNALGGVVNLITREDLDGHYLGASVEAGSFNTFELFAEAGIGNDDTYANISATRITSDGYDVSPDQTANGVPAVGSGAQPGDREGNDITSLTARGGMAITDMLKIKGLARYVKSDAELDGQAFNFPIAGRSYDDASSTTHEQVVIGGSAIIDPFDGFWETTLSASHVDESRRNFTTNFPFLVGPPVPSPADLLAVTLDPSGADSTRTKFGVLSTLRFGGEGLRHFLTGFTENEKETFDDPFSGRDESRTLNAVGLQYRTEIADQLNLYATVRHDNNDRFEDVDTWSLAASWSIPNSDTRLHASTGTGVTNPTFIEQFGFDPASFVGNAALVPEEAVGWDLGIEQKLLGDALTIDLTYFESELENEIFTDFLPGFIATPLNSSADSSRSGWELYFTAAPTDDISLAGSWTQLESTEPSGIEVRRPEQQGSLDASWRIMGDVKLNLGVSYNGAMYDTDFATFQRTRLDPYTLVRFGTAWQATDQIELYARVENLLDEGYQEVIGYNAAPQAAYIGLRFRDEASK
jgi:vitamin B12 transporter